MGQAIQFVVDHKVEIVTFLFLLSEALAMIPQVKANSVFGAIFNVLKSLKEKLVPAK
jgi:hypothetical protein